jgi:hypothetical protein
MKEIVQQYLGGSMSIPSNPDPSDDRKQLRFSSFLKSVHLICALLIAATSFPSYAADSVPVKSNIASLSIKPYLVGLFLTGWYAKEQIAHLIKEASDAVWPVNKQNKSAEESFADMERPIIIKTVNAAFQIAFKLMVKDAFKKIGFSDKISNTLATAFDAGIKVSSVLKLADAGIIPTLNELKEVLEQAITISPYIKPSEYRYTLNHPLDITQGTAQRCGAQDPYCLNVPKQGQPQAEQASESQLQDQILKLSSSLALSAAGWKLADVAYDIGQLVSPIVPKLLLPSALSGGELEKYLQKVVQRFSEIQFGDTFVRMLASLIREGHADLEKAYAELPEDKKNDPVARAKAAKEVEKSVTKDIVKGILGVIGYKVSWPAEQAFINALIA